MRITVQQLIEKLKEMPQDALVLGNSDDGYFTFINDVKHQHFAEDIIEDYVHNTHNAENVVILL